MNIYSRKNIPSNFYVYSYLREDGTPYYIGKGHKLRAWLKTKKEIQPPKNLEKIVIVEANLTEIGALALERRLIRWYGRKDNNTGILRNKTDGGEGVSGASLELKLKRSEIRKSQWTDPNSTYNSKILSSKISDSISRMWNDPDSIYQTPKCRENLSKSITEVWTRPEHRAKMEKKYIMTSPSGEIIKISGLRKFCKENNLNVSNMVQVAKGKKNTCSGWKCQYDTKIL